jgi:hypothetical protein
MAECGLIAPTLRNRRPRLEAFGVILDDSSAMGSDLNI